METDKHYFFEGLFIIVFSIAAAIFAVWLGSPGHRDDVLYRIHFHDSVSGLAVGDPVKYRGVDVGTVMLDDLPKVVEKFSAIEDQLKKVVTSVGGVTEKVKADPSLLLRRPEKK